MIATLIHDENDFNIKIVTNSLVIARAQLESELDYCTTSVASQYETTDVHSAAFSASNLFTTVAMSQELAGAGRHLLL